MVAAPFAARWYGRVILLLLCVALLTFSFAPFNQFYLAWIGLVPWLLVLRRMRGPFETFFWFWGAGIAFFIANMWWIVYVTGPGMVALMGLLGLYWAAVALIIWGTGFLNVDPAWSGEGPRGVEGRGPLLAVVLVPVIWVSLEWLRGNYPLEGLPWLFLGHTHSPALPLCQIADITGVYGISFWVMAVNVLIALLLIHRFHLRRLLPATGVVAGMTGLILAYGLFRLSENTTTPGPTVMVVQPNFPQDNSGNKGASWQELIDFHVDTTDRALSQMRPEAVDLVVWSETMMPPLNSEARLVLGDALDSVVGRLSQLASRHQVAMLVGGVFEARLQYRGDRWVAGDRRNAAYFIGPTGRLSAQRYDKIHIVPFGEYLPFKQALPALHRLFVALSPYDQEYFLQRGSRDELTVFRSGTAGRGGDARFVTPICFEDIDPALCARMFRGDDGQKRADFIVNITNDGWFKANEMPQHLQAAVFRSIENRVPTARSVNTGISGFIDSNGRTHGLLPVNTEGVSVATIHLDSRYSFYTRFGDVFALLCAAATGVMVVAAASRWWIKRLRRNSPVVART